MGHVHARSTADTDGPSVSPRVKRRIRTKASLAEIERKERGRINIPGPPRLRTLMTDAAEIPISEGSLVPASAPTSGPQRAHPYTPVGNAVGSSSFEMVPSVRARAASDRGFDDSAETIPIARANSSPSIIQNPTQSHSFFVVPFLSPKHSVCAPLCCKNMCCSSRFCTGGGGAAGSRSKQCPRARKANASPGEQSEAPRPRWKPGQGQNPRPENPGQSAHAGATQGAFL